MKDYAAYLLILCVGHRHDKVAGREAAAGGDAEAAAERIGDEGADSVAHLLVALGQIFITDPCVLVRVADARQSKVVREALPAHSRHCQQAADGKLLQLENRTCMGFDDGHSQSNSAWAELQARA